MDCAVNVGLRCQEVLMSVFEYQQGFPRDVVEVTRAVTFAEDAVELFHQDARRLVLPGTEQKAFFTAVVKLQNSVERWLAERGSSGVSRLLRIQPRMSIALFIWSASTNNLSLLRSLDIPKNDRYGRLATALAAWHGHLDALVYLSHHVPIQSLPHGVVDGAAARGHLDTVRFLCTCGASVWRPVNVAASCGHLHVVQYLHANKIGRLLATALDNAVEGGHLNVVDYLRRHHVADTCSSRAFIAAVAKGHAAMVHYLVQENLAPVTNSAIDVAKFNGDHEMVQFLLSAGRRQSGRAE
ncbi:hypothetical protein H310_04046 [Aphanomyces invadans]|uniref:Uncharacterized protein n=1 Tax=Aphanomyces invadans TaxID=157072 RepID=A0A024UFC9_9STRA|nr:hypothetical protein H310_04046 [Aphanomyces invadans]ETW04969.1 hypothetical protein H310_04046 [Aphanomyces invadans]|eukprot:XP_008866407.1 hypothetical protein H310_04046 [Aphanomyces invadans]